MQVGSREDLDGVLLLLGREPEQGLGDGVVVLTSRTNVCSSCAERMFSSAFSTRRNPATAWTWVGSSAIPMPPVSVEARNWPDGELANATLLKKLTASSIVTRALLWKNGPVSAASISDGVLKVPLPKPGTPFTLAVPKPPSGGFRVGSTKSAG